MSEKFIPLSVPNLKGNELKYVTDAVETEWVSTAGSYVTDFEKGIAAYVGMDSAVACQSGTAGLHISLQLCGVTRDDMVIVPTLTFIAAVNPVKYLGAEPVFMDCDDSLCLDPVKLERFCIEECELRDDVLYHKKTGRRIPAMVVVHVFGNMADMESILEIAERFCLKVVEDATEALGTKYLTGRYAGCFAGTMGTMGVYSFNGNKIMTTGGGGMIVSRHPELLQHAKHLTTQAKADEANFIHDEVGYNYRMTNLQAALGLAQLEQLDTFIETKTVNYDRYYQALSGIEGLTVMKFRPDIRSNHWFYALCCRAPFPNNNMELIEHLKTRRIQSRPIWGLIHEQKPYQGSLTYEIERAKEYWECVINLPCSSNLTEEDVERVIAAVKECVQEEGRN